MSVFSSVRACFAAVVSYICLALPAQADLTGMYMHVESDEISVIQLVETNDDQFVGRFEVHSLSERGRLKSDSFEIDGHVKDEQVFIRHNHGLSWASGAKTFSALLGDGFLDVYFEHGSARFQERDASMRDGALAILRIKGAHLAETAKAADAERAAARAAERRHQKALNDAAYVQRLLQEVKENLDPIVAREAELSETLESLLNEYQTLLREHRRVSKGIDAMIAMNTVGDVINAAYMRRHALRDKIFDIQHRINSIRHDLNNSTRFVPDSLERVVGYCETEPSEATIDRSFCDELPAVQADYESTLTQLRPHFEEWDRLNRSRD